MTLEGNYPVKVQSHCVSIISYCVSVSREETNTQLFEKGLIEKVIQYSKFATHHLMTTSVETLCIISVYLKIPDHHANEILKVLVRSLDYIKPQILLLSLQAISQFLLSSSDLVATVKELKIAQKLNRLQRSQSEDVKGLSYLLIERFFKNSFE